MICPIPVRRPAVIARKSAAISFAVPGADLNLTRLNAPATATPAPIFPFTAMMTTHTIAGRTAKVTTKLLLYLFLNICTKARTRPIARDDATGTRKSSIVSSIKKSSCFFFLFSHHGIYIEHSVF